MRVVPAHPSRNRLVSHRQAEFALGLVPIAVIESGETTPLRIYSRQCGTGGNPRSNCGSRFVQTGRPAWMRIPFDSDFIPNKTVTRSSKSGLMPQEFQMRPVWGGEQHGKHDDAVIGTATEVSEPAHNPAGCWLRVGRRAPMPWLRSRHPADSAPVLPLMHRHESAPKLYIGCCPRRPVRNVA